METIWQAKDTGIGHRIALMLKHSLLSDITFLTGPNKEKIHAHKMILASASRVFHSMFYGLLHETKEEIEIPDINGEVLKKVLKYIYTDEFPVSSNILAVKYAAQKYMVTDLSEFCFKIWIENLKPNNCLQAYQNALHYHEQELADICWYFIVKNISKVIDSPKFVYINQELLLKIISESRLVVDELKLYQAVVTWAKTTCWKSQIEATPENLRNALGDVLHAIRFPLMPLTDFLIGPAQEGVLEENDCTNIITSYVNKNKPDTKFNFIPRKYSEITVHFQSYIQNIKDTKIDSVRFISDSKLLFVGAGFLKSFIVWGETIPIYLEHQFTKEISISSLNASSYVDVIPSPDHARDRYTYYLDIPFVILPNNPYILYILVKERPEKFQHPFTVNESAVTFLLNIATKSIPLQAVNRSNSEVMVKRYPATELVSVYFFKTKNE